jgi:hypothetical protein
MKILLDLRGRVLAGAPPKKYIEVEIADGVLTAVLYRQRGGEAVAERVLVVTAQGASLVDPEGRVYQLPAPAPLRAALEGGVLGAEGIESLLRLLLA